jgi:hypothetical protein
MTATMQQLKSPKNPPETVIDKTPKTPFTSPLQKFIAQNCEQCTWYKGKCRLDDANGMNRMRLCIILYTYPVDFFKNSKETISELMKQLQTQGVETIG